MPSMSYCMFQNTALEMVQILSTMREADRPLKLSRDEQASYEVLVRQCQMFLQLHEGLTGEEIDLSDSCYDDTDFGYIDE